MKREEAKSKRRPLSDTIISSLEPETKSYLIPNAEGIYLRVKPNGRKDWQFRYKKPTGKWAWLGLGGYPQHKWSSARKKAQEFRDQLERGESPKTKRQQQVDSQDSQEFTFNARVQAWYNAKKGTVADTTLHKNMRRIEMYVLPAMGQRDIREIRPIEWVELLRGIEKGDGTNRETIERTRQVVKEIHSFAMFDDYIMSNPLEGARRYLPKSDDSTYSWVPIKEMPQLLRAIRGYDASEYINIGLFLISRLGLRTEPFRFALWSEIDFDHAVWHIPGEHMKGKSGSTGKPLDVPLPRQSIEKLRRLYELTGHTKRLFPGRNDPTKPVSSTAFLQALYRLGYKGLQTSHGFRHQFSTIAHEKWPNKSLVIEKQMAHKDASVRGIYNAAEYLEERRVLMQWYADYLDEIEGFNQHS